MSGERGKFITFEGIDSSGKGTQIRLLEEWLAEKNIRHIVTFEPGGTQLGLAVREILLSPNSVVSDPVVELLLFLAARKHHLGTVILPALDRGEWVICDRFTDSTYAYQGGGGKIDPQAISELSAAAEIKTDPDLTILLDVSPETSDLRRQARNTVALPSAKGREKSAEGQGLLWEDKFEGKRQTYFDAVRNAYLQAAEQSRGRIHVVDASKPEKEVHKQICRRISTRFNVG